MHRDSICWSLTDGCDTRYVYPEEIDYICDGLKLLRSRYNELGARLACAGMPYSYDRIKLRITNINELLADLGASYDNNLSDTSL